MRWFKLLDSNGEIIGAEAHEEPAFVYRQRNGVVVNCEERKAMGICSADGSVLYDLYGKESIGEEAVAVAEEIYWDEYNSIVHELPDPEDTEPEIPDDTPEEKILTRKELTDKVEMLEKMNAMLTRMLLENREDGMTASRSYSEGDLIIVDGTLYKVQSRIASGAALTVGTNVKQTTLAAEIAAVNS